MKFYLAALPLLLTMTCLADEPKAKTSTKSEPQKIDIWDGHAPNGDGTIEDKQVWITVHRPTKSNGTAVIICPGGGYGGLVVGAEGHGIAEWLNGHGVTGIVLEYRLPAGRSHVPLLDAQRALRTVRAHAKEWELDPAHIGIMGFSAGGHLASAAGTHFDEGKADAKANVDRVSCRPDFMILVYPVIIINDKTHPDMLARMFGKNPSAKQLDYFSSEKQVTDKTPPAFMAHAVDDKPVPPENSKVFHEALQAKKIPSKFLELPSGGHGLNGYKGPMWDAWQKQSLEWLTELKLMPAS